MSVSASGLSKILLQVIPRDFSKFSTVKIRPFFQRSRSLYRIHFPSQPRQRWRGPLTPGNYTALVFGVSGTTGTALVEVYDESASP